MGFSRKAASELYRPQGPKQVLLGSSAVLGATPGTLNIAQAIDLSLPIRGIRLVLRGRLVIGTAAFTSVNPEGLLNLISSVFIQGTNARQKGNLTLWNCDLATAWVANKLFAPDGAAIMTISITGAGGDATVPPPDTPFPGAGVAVPNHSAGYINGATGTYDFQIGCDFPFHPFASNDFGKHPAVVPGFLVRNEEWKDSLQLQISFGAQAGAGATGVLGVAAGTTTVAFSAYNSGAGTPTLDIYSLPVLMGLDQKDLVVPGVLSRTTQQFNTILQAAATNVSLVNMQKQPTPRVIAKFGTGTVAPAFATLSDTNVTALGISLGGNRNVRNKLPIFAHKMLQADVYNRPPIQGYNVLDFMEQGNPDSAFPGQDIGDGATFQLVGDVTGIAAGFGLVLQEQILHIPAGPLYPA